MLLGPVVASMGCCLERFRLDETIPGIRHVVMLLDWLVEGAIRPCQVCKRRTRIDPPACAAMHEAVVSAKEWWWWWWW